MITINKDRTAYIPESDRHIGFENDNLVETRYFDISDDDVSDFHFKLDIADTLDIIDLEKEILEDGRCVLVWKITSAVIGEGGIIRTQLRAFDENGERVWHSHIMEFVADASVNGEKQIDDERILSEFEQLETRVTSAVGMAEGYSNAAYTYSVVAGTHKENSLLYSKKSESSADVAKEYAESAKESENTVISKVSEFEKNYGNASEQANKANNHYTDKSNPHAVTASQIGVYTKEETDQKIEDIIAGIDLSDYAKTDDVSDIEAKMGDIDEALDRIIDIAEKLAPTASLM